MVHAAALPCSVITALATTLGLQKGTAQTSAMWHGNSLNMMMRNCEVITKLLCVEAEQNYYANGDLRLAGLSL